MYSRLLKPVRLALAMTFVALVPIATVAQNAPKPKTPAVESPSKWDIFAGYSFLAPKSTSNGISYDSIVSGGIGSVTRYFNNHLGVQFEGDVHAKSEKTATDGDFSGGSAGLIYRFPTSNITPFIHALVGGERAGGYLQSDTWGPVVTAGGGLDYNTPLFDHHLAIRLFQADYQYVHENFDVTGSSNFNMARLSAGIVYHIGSIAPPPPVTLACSVNPASIFPGDPVTVTATAGNLNPNLNAIYIWSGTGVTSSGTIASVATGSLAAGTYTVKGTVKEGKAGKEGLKPGESADCTASYQVKAFEPPTISCSANPSTIKPGGTSTITAVAMSPQNRPLTYGYSASSGSASGNGTTETFSSVGAPTGTAGITCSVTDDKGQTATSNTSVTIVAPYVAPAPHTQAMCSITFERDKKRPTRVDNEAKACLDEVALSLQKQSDAKAVVVGEADAAEKAKTAKEERAALRNKHIKVEDFAAQRAVNARDYLVTEKGIDASRVSVATSAADGQKVEDYLVPSGANFPSDVRGTTSVDETKMKPQGRKPLAEKKHKKAAK